MNKTKVVFAAPNHITTVQLAPHARDVQAGLEQFRLEMVGRYQTPTGQVVVSTPFGMNVGDQPVYDEQLDVLSKAKRRSYIDNVAQRLGYYPQVLARVRASRGTPTEIHRLAQGLVDHPPPMKFENEPTKIWSPGDVRHLMHAYSLCIDCAGYVQQAYLCAWERTRAQANFSEIVNENLAGLSGRGYRRISKVADVRPGDLVVLEDAGPPLPDGRRPVGHRAIVYDQRLATDDDMTPLANDPDTQSFTRGGPIRALELDSSWGSSGNYKLGGVQRRLFLFNESTQRWANTRWDEYMGWDVYISDKIYDHLLDGFYRRHGD